MSTKSFLILPILYTFEFPTANLGHPPGGFAKDNEHPHTGPIMTSSVIRPAIPDQSGSRPQLTSILVARRFRANGTKVQRPKGSLVLPSRATSMFTRYANFAALPGGHPEGIGAYQAGQAGCARGPGSAAGTIRLYFQAKIGENF